MSLAVDHEQSRIYSSALAKQSLFSWVHLDTTTTRRGSAKRNAAFTLQHGAMLTTRQPEGCVPAVVSRCALFSSRAHFWFALPGSADTVAPNASSHSRLWLCRPAAGR